MMDKAEGTVAALPQGMDLFDTTDGFLTEIRERAQSRASQRRVRGFVVIATLGFSCQGGCQTIPSCQLV